MKKIEVEWSIEKKYRKVTEKNYRKCPSPLPESKVCGEEMGNDIFISLLVSHD